MKSASRTQMELSLRQLHEKYLGKGKDLYFMFTFTSRFSGGHFANSWFLNGWCANFQAFLVKTGYFLDILPLKKTVIELS